MAEYYIVTRKPHGRKWYRADSSSGSYDYMTGVVIANKRNYPALEWGIASTAERYKIAPNRISAIWDKGAPQ